MWRNDDPAGKTAWQNYTAAIDEKALEIAQRRWRMSKRLPSLTLIQADVAAVGGITSSPEWGDSV